MTTRLASRAWLSGVVLLASTLIPGVPSMAEDQPAPPPFVTRGLPGDAHRSLEPLVGKFTVDATFYMAAGTPEKPAVVHGLHSSRRWAAGGRVLEDVTTGLIAPGTPYWRTGHLGYSNEDGRYEWTTFDATNTNRMIYLGARGGGLDMRGEFTDQGLIAGNAGKATRQRTVIAVDGADRNTMRLYMTPPGKPEFLAQEMVYTRAHGSVENDPVLLADRDLSAAYAHTDLSALDSLLASDFVFISSKGQSQTRAQVMDDYRSARIRTIHMRLEDPHVDAYGTTAVLTGRQFSEDVIGGETVKAERRIMRVYVNRDGTWKLAAFQLSPPLARCQPCRKQPAHVAPLPR